LSETICNDHHAAWAMFCQSKTFCFPTEKKPDFVRLFLISKKSQSCLKKARISKSGFKKAKLSTLLDVGIMEVGLVWSKI